MGLAQINAGPSRPGVSSVFFALARQWGLLFFLPQIVKDFGLTSVQAGFVTAILFVIGAIGMVHWGMAFGQQPLAEMARDDSPASNNRPGSTAGRPFSPGMEAKLANSPPLLYW